MIPLSTRAQIVVNADHAFHEGGHRSTSFSTIADRVGISRGNFHHHFRTKDAILSAVIDHRVEKARGVLDDLAEGEPDPVRRILQFVESVLTNRESTMRSGCPNGALSLELARSGHRLEAASRQMLDLFCLWLGAVSEVRGHR